MKNNLIFSFFLLMITSSCNFGAGSCPYAETYIINLPESEVVTRIKGVKNRYPEYFADKFGDYE